MFKKSWPISHSLSYSMKWVETSWTYSSWRFGSAYTWIICRARIRSNINIYIRFRGLTKGGTESKAGCQKKGNLTQKQKCQFIQPILKKNHLKKNITTDPDQQFSHRSDPTPHFSVYGRIRICRSPFMTNSGNASQFFKRKYVFPRKLKKEEL